MIRMMNARLLKIRKIKSIQPHITRTIKSIQPHITRTTIQICVDNYAAINEASKFHNSAAVISLFPKESLCVVRLCFVPNRVLLCNIAIHSAKRRRYNAPARMHAHGHRKTVVYTALYTVYLGWPRLR